MLRLIFFGFLLLVGTSSASAATIKGAHVGCLTKNALDEFVTAATNKDYKQMNALLGRTCVSIEGREYSIVKRGFVKSRVRVYVGENSVLLWVVSEAVR